jgi:hypothetical protein
MVSIIILTSFVLTKAYVTLSLEARGPFITSRYNVPDFRIKLHEFLFLILKRI